MLPEKARALITQNLSDEEDIDYIKKYLTEIDRGFESFSMVEILALWEAFSGGQLGIRFQVVGDDEVEELIEWIGNNGYMDDDL